MKLTRMLALGTLALALAGCGTAAAVQPPAPASADPATTPPPAAVSCLLEANGGPMQVVVGNSSQSCDQWIRDLAPSGVSWSTVSPPSDQSLKQICRLTSGSSTMTISDGGWMDLASYGDQLCSQEEQNGWLPS